MTLAETGPFAVGDLVQLTDAKGRHHTITLADGAVLHTHKGGLAHDDLIGSSEGVVVTTSGGAQYLALRPILEDYVLAMGRKAAIVYPKDAFAIVGLAGIGPGSRVVEAGAGSGGLTCFLLNAVGPEGQVTSYEVREEFAEVARRNVQRWFRRTAPAASDYPRVPELDGTRSGAPAAPGGAPLAVPGDTSAPPANWVLQQCDFTDDPEGSTVDAAVLDLLAPWDCVEAVAGRLRPGGRLVTYVATTTQLSRMAETLRADGRFTEPRATETLVRTWHLEGLAVRPDHRMVAHTAFLLTCRRLADGTTPPRRKRRPAPGAYGPDYAGPRPAGLAPHDSTTQD